LTSGYRQVIAEPAAGEPSIESQVPGLDPSLVHAELSVLLPSFDAPGGVVGALSADRLRAWAARERRFGIVTTMPEVATMFTNRFLPRG
jgi:hypothetical protein